MFDEVRQPDQHHPALFFQSSWIPSNRNALQQLHKVARLMIAIAIGMNAQTFAWALCLDDTMSNAEIVIARAKALFISGMISY